MRQVLLLVKNGVPWDVAVNLSEIELTAYCIAIGEMDGHEFDWRRMEWKQSRQ